MMRLDEDEGLLGAMGYGYNAVRRGSVFHVYKCTKIQVNYRHQLEDTKDIPVTYEDSMGVEQHGYLDVVTRKLKNSSIVLKSSKEMPLGWNFDGQYMCKAGDLVPCSPPELLPVDFGVVRDALKQRNGDVVLDGSLEYFPEISNKDNNQDKEKQKVLDVEYIVQHDNNVKSQKAKIAQEIQNHDYRHLFGDIGMPKLQKEVNEAADNTGFIGRLPKIIGYISAAILILVAIYRVIFLWYSELPWSVSNIFWAIFLPSTIYTQQVREQMNQTRDRLKYLHRIKPQDSVAIDMPSQ